MKATSGCMLSTSRALSESGFFALPGSWRKASDLPQQRKSDLGDSDNNGRAGLVFISDTGRETCAAGSMVTTPPFLHKGNPCSTSAVGLFSLSSVLRKVIPHQRY